MKLQLENVNVTDHGFFYENLGLSWEFDGARYHIWENSTDVLYKNPPITIKHDEPGYFRTRKLDPGSKVNQAMILEARSIARRDDLYKKAAIAQKQKAHAEKMAQLAAIAVRRKHDAGEVLYDACERALAALNDMTTTDFSLGKDKPIRELLREALAKADKGE
jgi:hypothetical protein